MFDENTSEVVTINYITVEHNVVIIIVGYSEFFKKNSGTLFQSS